MATPSITPTKSSHPNTHPLWLWIIAVLCLAAAGGWILLRSTQTIGLTEAPQQTVSLTSGVTASLDSPVFSYSEGWRVSPAGADPTEPDNAWSEPSGQVTFTYTGRELALQLAVGNYWGYIFVTVDGAPANRLASISGNTNGKGQVAGYKPLLAPERQTDAGPATRWVPVHSATDDGPHEVTVEVWRSWGQTPLRAVAVDALPVPLLPLWPAVALSLAGVWSLYFGLRNRTLIRRIRRIGRSGAGRSYTHGFSRLAELHQSLSAFIRVHLWLNYVWLSALLTVGAGVVLDNWVLTDIGLALLALSALVRPELWVASLLFGLPFYLYSLPILPGRGLNLIEVGIWGGLGILAAQRIFFQRRDAETQRLKGREEKGKRQKGKAKVSAMTAPTQYGVRNTQSPIPSLQSFLLALLLSFALLSALAAQEMDVAVREWRTLFLAAGGFALLLGWIFALSDDPDRSRRMLVNAWLAGGTAVALIAIWQFATGQMIIQAEGVERVRGLYGSPNNLALYLERTLAVSIGYWVIRYWILDDRRITRATKYPISNTYYLLSILIQLAALALTFSKGALLLGIPAMLLVLGVGGATQMERQGKPRRRLWLLVGIGGAVVLGLLPYVGTERFRLLLDFGAGTTGGLRLNLWRSAWAMALDHPWLGVGPDNFLYAYRSDYILPAAWQDPSLNHPHNFVLDWWTRLGLPGLLLAALWLGAGIRQLWNQLRSGVNAGLALGCLAAIAAALAHGLIDASYALPDLMLVWVLLLFIPTARYPQSLRPE
jgi:putative inorganic carbon (HCO3(-)) transporter